MASVAVHDPTGVAFDVAKRILPKLQQATNARRAVARASNIVLATTDEGALDRDTLRVGSIPNDSFIRRTNGALIVERGPAWTAPIFVRQIGSSFIAATSLAPLTMDGDAVDVRHLATGIAMTLRPSETVNPAIRLVAPMQRITVDRAGVRVTSMSTDAIPEHVGDHVTAAHELLARMTDAVDRATRGRKVGLLLSGGLDSSALLAILLGLGREVYPLTIDFAAPGDDRPYVRALEDFFSIKVERVRPIEAHPFNVSALILDGAPARHAFHPLEVLCAHRLRELGADILVTGAGGDEIFGGDLVTLSGGFMRGDVRALHAALRAEMPVGIPFRRRLRGFFSATLRPRLPKTFRRWIGNRRSRRPPSWAGPVLREELARRALEAADDAPVATTAAGRFDLLARSARISYVAEERAKSQTLTNMPHVDPFFDEDLVRFVASLRPSMLYADGVYRGLLRRALSGRIPDVVRTRTDKGDFEPAFADMMWPLGGLSELLGFEKLERCGVVHAKLFREHIDPLVREPNASMNGHLWGPFYSGLTAEAFLAAR